MILARRIGAAATLALAAVVLTACNGTPAPAQTVYVTAAPPATATDAPPPPPSDGDVPTCQASQLLVTYTATDGTAGHFHGVLDFETPQASGDCSLWGYPTLQFTSSSSASGIFGPLSEVTGSSADVVVLHGGDSAHADVTITDPGVVACTAKTAKGFIVTPPGVADGIFVAVKNLTGCTDTGIVQVGAVVAG